MQTISEDYRGLNIELHKTNPNYGMSGQKWGPAIMAATQAMQTTDVLDYGCGKSTLAKTLPFNINQYDPAIPRFKHKPEPADLLVCTDVLEHIEPDMLDSVLDDIKNLTKKAAFLVVATGPAHKTLSDGRNAHLIQERPKWWESKLSKRFNSVVIEEGEGGFTAICEK